MNERIAIGIDLGGTFIKAGLMTESGLSLGAWKEPTNAADGPQAVIAGLKALTYRILKSDAFLERKAKYNSELAGIGIGSPGIMDPRAGVVRRATGNLPGWTGMEIVSIFETEFGIRTYLDNDANAYVLGEYLFGVGQQRKPRVLLGLTLGTGVGGGVVDNGRLVHGAHGCGGELGHIGLSQDPDAPPCSCGLHGCLESFAAGPAISNYATSCTGEYPNSLIFQIAGDRPVHTEIIHQAAVQNDPLALHVIERTARYLGFGLATLIICFDPDLVVIGGGVANFGELLLAQVRQAVKDRVYFHSMIDLEIVPAQLGSEDGYKGAAGLALFPSD